MGAAVGCSGSTKFQLIGAVVVAFACRAVSRITTAAITLIIAFLALSAPIFQSHSASGGSHLVAIGTLLVHVIAITLWVGGLISILINRSLDQRYALKRFSQLALWAAIAVVISGAVNAWIRLNFSGALISSYAILVFEKIVLTCFPTHQPKHRECDKCHHLFIPPPHHLN